MGEEGRIQGVWLKRLRVVPDERGWLMEVLRRDDEGFLRFGQAYVTTTYPGVVKGWHMHRKQSDFIACIGGMLKLVLYDPREGSPTKGKVEEYFLGIHNPLLVRVPENVYHGWKCVGPEAAVVLNVPTEPYDHASPDEVRLDPHTGGIPYDWTRKDR
jgi:dTDP-4-dehydrorhamnose 3,5-epimerase